jgi:uncharacterized membrane protein
MRLDMKMELGEKKQINRHKKRVAKVTRFRRRRQLQGRYQRYIYLLSGVLSICVLVIMVIVIGRYRDNRKANESQNALINP